MIPSQPSHKDFKPFLELEEDQLDDIVSALKDVKPSLDFGSIATQVASLTGIKQSLLESHFEFFATVHSQSDDTEEFIDTSSSALDYLANALKIDLSESRKESILTYIQRLFSLECALGISTKAQEVILESEHLFRKSRIVTDLRPLFLNGPEKPPEFATMVHNLTVSYHQNENPFSIQSTTFALDSDDLRDLEETVRRALTKEDTLRDQAEKLYKGVIL